MAKPISDWTRDDLQAFVDNGVQESANLEFKASQALELAQNNRRSELVKDVTAMANAAGGMIIYGIAEDGTGRAARIDDGVPPNITAEQIEQILISNVSPRLTGVTMARIPLGNNNFAFVMDIAQATTFAPHQSTLDKKYYRRWEKTTQSLMDYEIRDMMRRGTRPALRLGFSLNTIEDYWRLVGIIGNDSEEPVLYYCVDVGLEATFPVHGNPPEGVTTPVEWHHQGRNLAGTRYTRNFSVPHHIPIFKGRDGIVFECKVKPLQDTLFRFYYHVAAPGFSTTGFGALMRLGNAPPVLQIA